MPYADFTLEAFETTFGLIAEPAELFPGLAPVSIPTWLQETLARGREVAALVSEKARSEFLVAPVLLAVRELVPGELAIFSGQRLDVDPARSLVGECDYILARTSAVPRLRAPLAVILEAKKGDVEASLGQCAAQMMGARVFNERAGSTKRPMFGCVTTGEVWQFLELTTTNLRVDRLPLFSDNLGEVLAAFQLVLGGAPAAAAAAH
jgi:hypothetical protein